MSVDQLGLYYNQVQSFALNQIDEFGLDEAQVAAAQHYREISASLAYKKNHCCARGCCCRCFVGSWGVSSRLCVRVTMWRICWSGCFFICSFIAVLTTLGIVLSVLFEAIRFFSSHTRHRVSVWFAVEPPDGNPIRPGGGLGILWLYTSAGWHLTDFHRCSAHSRTGRIDVGNLSQRVCVETLSCSDQAGTGRCWQGCLRWSTVSLPLLRSHRLSGT